MTTITSPTALLLDLLARLRPLHPDRTLLVGVAGAQGAGKTTACRRVAAADPRLAHFSLDDVYLTRAERAELGRRSHPLFVTRGPPGTHDIGLALDVIATLRNAAPETRTALPRFDKARDDRAPEAAWASFNGRPESILVDGWCLGALPDALGEAPINRLESEEDADGRWRAQVRSDLAGRYRDFFAQFDAIVYFAPPSWEVVRRWRRQQEEETLGRSLTPEDDARLNRFLQHYERITRSMMNGGHTARWVAHLDEHRNVTHLEERPNPPRSTS